MITNMTFYYNSIYILVKTINYDKITRGKTKMTEFKMYDKVKCKDGLGIFVCKSGDSQCIIELNYGGWRRDLDIPKEYISKLNNYYSFRHIKGLELVGDTSKLQERAEENIKNIKIHVRSEVESIYVQEKLFELGVNWFTKPPGEAKYTDSDYLYVNNDLELTKGDDPEWFEGKPYKEVTPEELLGYNDKTFRELTSINFNNGNKIFNRINEVKQMEIKNIKQKNLVQAKKLFEEEQTNEEVKYARDTLRSAVDNRDRLDRDIKVLEEEKKPYLETISKIMGAK